MDISHFDQRGKAEEGIFVPLCEPFKDGKPIGKGDDAPGFMVRGIASRSAQDRLAEMQKAASEDETDEQAAMERVHQNLIEAAMRYIISPKNIEANGRLISSDEDVRKVLDMTFPEVKLVRSDDGTVLTMEATTKDGDKISVPRFEVTNWPFAQQVIDAAEDSTRFLGKRKKG